MYVVLHARPFDEFGMPTQFLDSRCVAPSSLWLNCSFLGLLTIIRVTGGIMFKNILVPIDGSELAAAAARKAVEFAKTIQASVCAFHSMPMFAGAPGEFGYSPVTSGPQAEKMARSYLAVIEEYARECAVPCQSFSKFHDSTYHAIIEAAEEHHCDLIFMGSHGRGALSSLFVGSVTQQVMSHSYIPVLVYRDEKIAARMKHVTRESKEYRI
jgi:nucleotide-binding universal stress UspA family protein